MFQSFYIVSYSYTGSFTFSSCSQVILPVFPVFLKKLSVTQSVLQCWITYYLVCISRLLYLCSITLDQDTRVIDSVSYFPCFSSLCYRLYLSRKQGVLFEITEVQRDEAPCGRVPRTLQNHRLGIHLAETVTANASNQGYLLLVTRP